MPFRVRREVDWGVKGFFNQLGRKGKERKGKERKGKERKGERTLETAKNVLNV